MGSAGGWSGQSSASPNRRADDADPNPIRVVGRRPRDDWYVCAGGTYYATGGLCVDLSTRDVYIFIGVAAPTGFSLSVGQTQNADALLSGWPLAATGTPGGAVSFDGQLRPVMAGYRVGYIGGSFTYGINLSANGRRLLDDFSRGVTDYMYRSLTEEYPCFSRRGGCD